MVSKQILYIQCLSLFLSRYLPICTRSFSNLVTSYTREAGVRTLERRLGAVCRAAAVKIVESDHDEVQQAHIDIDEEQLEDILGPPLFDMDIDSRLNYKKHYQCI